MANEKILYGYPEPKQAQKTAYAPKVEANPVLAGRLLTFGAYLVSSIGFIPSLLWSNAGFDGLRNVKVLSEYSPRHDPTVIPVSTTDRPSTNYTDPSVSTRDTARRSYYSIADYHELYLSGKVTPLQVAQSLLPYIRRDLSECHRHSTAFIDTQVNLVWIAARASSERYRAGKPLGVLDGVPFAVKDEVDVDGYRTTKGKSLDKDAQEFKEKTEWPVQMWEDEGAILMGKLNMHELGTDVTNNNPGWGTPLNPYNDQYYTGGSSGGSGYVVATGLVPFALGADGGGSIRIPSSFCGVYGLKPTHGRIGDTGSTVTVLGPLASSIADLEISYRVLAKPNSGHPVCSLFESPQPFLGKRSKVLGICEAWFDRADASVQSVCRAAIDYLVAKQGYTVLSIDLPYLSEGQKAHNLTILAEMATNAKVNAPEKGSWLNALSMANRILLSVGSQSPASDFILAQQLRHLHMAHLAFLYRQHPGLMIVTPTSPIAGYEIRDKGDLTNGVSDGNRTVRAMEYVWLANWTGCPALSCPAGYVNPDKGEGQIPVGLMAMGEWGSEDELIEWGRDVEGWLEDENGAGGRLKAAGWEDVIGNLSKKDWSES